ncbi:unnamed protein product [Ostreobium quekettii]|uniref:Uncharacterized protein n=1 Tax=Ostreobium quekettii TaxID=121088 RepID=A0A8S1J1K1_9CHLO|nr:unnamed protein product [Ostreobium quekettii]
MCAQQHCSEAPIVEPQFGRPRRIRARGSRMFRIQQLSRGLPLPGRFLLQAVSSPSASPRGVANLMAPRKRARRGDALRRPATPPAAPDGVVNGNDASVAISSLEANAGEGQMPETLCQEAPPRASSPQPVRMARETWSGYFSAHGDATKGRSTSGGRTIQSITTSAELRGSDNAPESESCAPHSPNEEITRVQRCWFGMVKIQKTVESILVVALLLWCAKLGRNVGVRKLLGGEDGTRLEFLSSSLRELEGKFEELRAEVQTELLQIKNYTEMHILRMGEMEALMTPARTLQIFPRLLGVGRLSLTLVWRTAVGAMETELTPFACLERCPSSRKHFTAYLSILALTSFYSHGTPFPASASP